MKLLVLLVAVISAVTADMMCRDEKTHHGETEIMMIEEGSTHTIACPEKMMTSCRWWHHNMRMPMEYGSSFRIDKRGNLKITRVTVHHSGSYTLETGSHWKTYHIIVKPKTHTPMNVDENMHHFKNMTFTAKHWYNSHVRNVVFENVHFMNVHWHMMRFENVMFKNCYFHWDHDYPMHAEFHHCHFENTGFNKPHFRHCSFSDCHFTGGHHMDHHPVESSMHTFYHHHIHDSVFCNVTWDHCHWEYGRWYNTTFNHNIFMHHHHMHEKFHNHHFDVIRCHDFDHATMTMVRWMHHDDMCWMLVHRPNTHFHYECHDMHEMMRHVCAEHHHSVHFYDCRFEECSWDHCHMDSIEWRHCNHHRSHFERCNMTAHHFVNCHHYGCTWENMHMMEWMKFTANTFHSHRHHWLSAHHVSHHSCHFEHHHWHCKDCREAHFWHCWMDMFEMHEQSHIRTMPMRHCGAHGFKMAGKIDRFHYCHVHKDDIHWDKCLIGDIEDTCDDNMHWHMYEWCKTHPHHPTCLHMWMSLEHHCCHDDRFHCHRRPHHWWRRHHLHCDRDRYDGHHRGGDWMDRHHREHHYREWCPRDDDTHWWTIDHRLPMVHCLHRMHHWTNERHLTVHNIHRDTANVINEHMTHMMDHEIHDHRHFYEMMMRKHHQFWDHMKCLRMYE